MKHRYLKKKSFTVIYTWKALQMLIKGMQKKVWKEFKRKNLGEYHDLYVQSDILLLADVLENSRNKCTEIYELDSAHFFLSALD